MVLAQHLGSDFSPENAVRPAQAPAADLMGSFGGEAHHFHLHIFAVRKEGKLSVNHLPGLKKLLSQCFLFPWPFFWWISIFCLGEKKNLCCNVFNLFYYQLQNYGYCYKWFTLEIIRKVSPNWVCLVIGKVYHFKPPRVHTISLGSLVPSISPAI